MTETRPSASCSASFRCDMERIPPLSVETSRTCDISLIPFQRGTPHKGDARTFCGYWTTYRVVKADVRDPEPEQVQAAVQRPIEKFGRIDFVINGPLSGYPDRLHLA